MGAEGPAPAASREFELASLLAAIVESSADAIIGKELDGTITTWNAGAAHMYGYTAGEIVGRNVSVLIPPDRAGELMPILDRLRRGERVEHFETKRLCKDGRVLDVSVSISPIRGGGGAVVGASTVTRDMTERNLAEAERHAIAQERHHTERLRTLGQLAGGIAHDFNNLLFAILSYAGFVAEESADRPAVRADAEQIQAAAQRAEQLTRQLLVFSRRDSAKTEVLDLNVVIAGLRSLLSTSIRSASIEADIELRVGPVAHLATIAGDRGQVEQVLLNLAVNARDAMPQGGTLTIGTRVTELDEGYARLHPGVSPGPYVELAVTDTGTGMSAEVRARIFEPFFTTKPAADGTGLGLSAVYGIVTEAGGSISVDSEEGTGTTFRLFFPPIGAPSMAAQARAAPAALGRGATILVVDDERPVLEITSRILRQDGYAILEAGSYDDAVSLASSQEFQLLLTDRVLPRGSGPALADRVEELRPGVLVLHMSGYAAGMLDSQLISDGELAFIQKPFTSQELLEKVHAMLGSPPAV
jgi:two-component system cell cycle sensor histidine kinase/response regulator CckA